MRRRAGWTLLELMVAGSSLLLLLGLSTMALSSYGRTLRGLEREGDQMVRAAHSMEQMQSLILQSRPIPVGVYSLRERPLELELLSGEKRSLASENCTVTLRREGGRTLVEIARATPALTSRFEATTRP